MEQRIRVIVAVALLAPLWVSLSPSIAAQDTHVRIRTKHGTVEGISLDAGVHSFRGIPYAAPPVRELRWKPPQAVVGWQGVRERKRVVAARGGHRTARVSEGPWVTAGRSSPWIIGSIKGHQQGQPRIDHVE